VPADLMPAQATIRLASDWILLVDGEPDMIAARSHGLPAIAPPGSESGTTSGIGCRIAVPSERRYSDDRRRS
jgi:hypothetical protein